MNIESALISALLQDNSKWLDVRSQIGLTDIVGPKTAVIWRGLEAMDGRADLTLITDWLVKNGYKDYIGYVTELYGVGDSIYIDDYVREIKETSRRRELNVVAENIKAGKGTTEQIMREAESKIISLYSTPQQGFRSALDISRDYASRMAMIASKGLTISGLSSGLNQLDGVTDGFKPGELIVIGARPSIGKTSMLVGIADHLAVNQGKNVAVFSIESPETELFHRFVSRRACISLKKLRTARFTEAEQIDVVNAVETISRSNMFINSMSTIDVLTIRAQIKRKMVEGDKPDIVFVDYLQIIDVEDGYDTFAKKLGRVVKGLKGVAKELDAPVVVLAQINRSNEERAPRLMDLKDSGDTEAVADMVILLHREEFYHKDDCKEEKKGKIDIDVAKNRNGQTMSLELLWSGEYMRISEPYT